MWGRVLGESFLGSVKAFWEVSKFRSVPIGKLVSPKPDLGYKSVDSSVDGVLYCTLFAIGSIWRWLEKLGTVCKLGDASQLELEGRGELDRGLSGDCSLWLCTSFEDPTLLGMLGEMSTLVALLAELADRMLLVGIDSGDWSSGCWCQTKLPSFTEPTLVWFM